MTTNLWVVQYWCVLLFILEEMQKTIQGYHRTSTNFWLLLVSLGGATTVGTPIATTTTIIILLRFDHKLVWDPEDFGGVNLLHVPSTHIWLPDIVLYNK